MKVQLGYSRIVSCVSLQNLIVTCDKFMKVYFQNKITIFMVSNVLNVNNIIKIIHPDIIWILSYIYVAIHLTGLNFVISV